MKVQLGSGSDSLLRIDDNGCKNDERNNPGLMCTSRDCKMPSFRNMHLSLDGMCRQILFQMLHGYARG